MNSSSQNREGYIRNPWSKENDAIHITDFFHRIEKSAGKRSGCHYEVFERMCLDSLLQALYQLEELSPKDAQYVRDKAPYRGYDLSSQGQRQVDDAYAKTMAEIRLHEM